MSTAVVAAGSRVTVAYALRLPDGHLVEEATAGDALEFTLGDGTLATALEQRLRGLCSGERKCFTVAGGEAAFGPHDPDKVRTLPRAEFPTELAPQPGQLIAFALPDGDELPGVVLRVDAQQVTVDFNHPLVGRDFLFEVEILAIG